MTADEQKGCGCVALIGMVGCILLSNLVKSCVKESTTSSYVAPVVEAKWHEGGTLSNCTVEEWKRASDRNKLATCASWITASWLEGYLVKDYTSISEARSDAERLRHELDTLAANPTTNEKTKMAVLVALAMIEMKLLKNLSQ